MWHRFDYSCQRQRGIDTRGRRARPGSPRAGCAVWRYEEYKVFKKSRGLAFLEQHPQSQRPPRSMSVPVAMILGRTYSPESPVRNQSGLDVSPGRDSRWDGGLSVLFQGRTEDNLRRETLRPAE
jgi:hypothetical protein